MNDNVAFMSGYFPPRRLIFTLVFSGLAALVVIIAGYISITHGPGKKSVVLIIVDTMGAKHSGFLEPNLHNTPQLDKLAQQGVTFSRAYSVT